MITLKTHRKQHGYTQQEVAGILHISRQAYLNYEHGKRSPSLTVLIKLADLYHVSLDDLVDRAF